MSPICLKFGKKSEKNIYSQAIKKYLEYFFYFLHLRGPNDVRYVKIAILWTLKCTFWYFIQNIRFYFF